MDYYDLTTIHIHKNSSIELTGVVMLGLTEHVRDLIKSKNNMQEMIEDMGSSGGLNSGDYKRLMEGLRDIHFIGNKLEAEVDNKRVCGTCGYGKRGIFCGCWGA